MAGEGISSNVRRILACPHCGFPLLETGNGGARCTPCGLTYTGTRGGVLDLRLRGPRRYELGFELSERAPRPDLIFEPLRPHPNPR